MSESEPVPQVRSTNARTIAIITVFTALVAGILLGIVGDRLWTMRHMRERSGPHWMASHLMERLDRQLRLSPSQEQEVRRMIESHGQRISAITATTRPQIRQEIEKTNAEIERVLTPDQRVKFRQMRMRMRARSQPPR